LIIFVLDIQLLVMVCLIWIIQLTKGENRKPPIETSNRNLMMGFHLRIKDNSLKYLIAILAWPFGSGLVITVIRRYSTAGWTIWFGSIFTIGWGANLFWMVLAPESSSSLGIYLSCSQL
jgi:hypothetical protein